MHGTRKNFELSRRDVLRLVSSAAVAYRSQRLRPTLARVSGSCRRKGCSNSVTCDLNRA